MDKVLAARLCGIRDALWAAFKSGDGASSATKGRERELFISEFLGISFPPMYRFASGDVVDSHGGRTGQLDVVIEYPFFPSLPVWARERIYLAEGVAAVIEVKSDLTSQWKDVLATTEKVKALTREFKESMQFSDMGVEPRKIPVFAVGYRGWKTRKVVQDKIEKSDVDGILVLEPPSFYHGRSTDLDGNNPQASVFKGHEAVWRLYVDLHDTMATLVGARVDLTQYGSLGSLSCE